MAVHESYNKDDDGHDERHHGEDHDEVDHDTAVAPTEGSQRNPRWELFSPFFITTMVKMMISTNAGRRIMIMTMMIIVSQWFLQAT